MPKTRRSASSACPLQCFGNKKNHMPDARGACRAYDWGFDGGLLLPPPANSFHRLRAVPLPRGGRSGGFASSRNLVYNPGCRVETLLVSMGVMGFLGDSRGRNSKSPPNPLGLAERVYSFHRPRGGPPPSKREVWGFAGQGLRPCRRLHIGALRSPLSPFARLLEGLLL